ncbi:MAG: DUF1902 domain-containing protein [Acidobacteriota bacterium]
MILTLNLPPDLEDRLRHEAERRGLTASALAMELLDHQLDHHLLPSRVPAQKVIDLLQSWLDEGEAQEERETFTFHVQASWDPETSVWVATSEDVPGLSTEATSLEALTEKLRVMGPELLKANQLLSDDREIALRLTSIKAGEWPESFWRAFEGMPEDFERPPKVR